MPSDQDQSPTEGPTLDASAAREELTQLFNARQAQAIEEALVTLANFYHPGRRSPSDQQERVEIAYCYLIELPLRVDSIFSAIEVCEALGHRVHVEFDRGDIGNGRTIPFALQFFTFRDLPGKRAADDAPISGTELNLSPRHPQDPTVHL